MFYEISGGKNTPIPLDTIKLDNGEYYTGNDELRMKLAMCYREVDEKYFKKGEPVILENPAIRSGLGKGNQGYCVPRITRVQTSKGDKVVVWCDYIDTNINPNQPTSPYVPLLYSVGPKEKTKTLTEVDIEEIIFNMLLNPYVFREGNKFKVQSTKIQDKEAEALQFGEKEAVNSIITYWLWTPGIGFYDKEKKVAILCLAWGIPTPEKWSIAMKKKLLTEAIRRAEKNNELQFGNTAFNEACKKLQDDNDIHEIEVLALIQKSVDKKIIAYSGSPDFKWNMLSTDKSPLKVICKVAPNMTAQSRNVLKEYLLHSTDDEEQLIAMCDGVTIESVHDMIYLTAPLPEEITEDFIKDDLPWGDTVKIFRYLGGRGKGKEVIHPYLIQKLVQEKVVVNWKVKE